MKTTVEISDALLKQAKDVAVREGRTLRSLIEDGLRMVLGEKAHTAGFRLRRESFRGRGLHDAVKDGSWERIRDMAYEGRGG